MSLIPSWVAKIPHVSWPKTKQNKTKQKQYCNKLNKDFKVGPEEETRGITWGVKQQIIHSTI